MKNTRSSTKSFDLYMVVFGCAATATINIQVMEGGKDTDCFLDAFNRFFSEACVPKVFFPDKDGALLKLLAEGEVDLRNLEGILSKERGICFRTCSAQGHSAHGRIEARIKMIQESLERSSIKKEKLHSLGWQTVAKLVEREVNSIPLGYLHHETDMGVLLRVLSPNCLKLNTSSDRAPAGVFSVPRTAASMMKKIETTYTLWYKIWNEEYIPLVAQRQKWHSETENLVENDIIYFKLRDSKLAQSWLIGKVEFIDISKDGKVRTVGVSYKHDTEDGERKFSIVERPARECIKLFNIEDTSLLDDIRAVQISCKKILDEEQIVPQSILDDTPKMPETEVFGDNDDERDQQPKPTEKKRRKKRTELENLKIDEWKLPLKPRRSPKLQNFATSNPSNLNNFIIGMQISETTDPLDTHDEVDDENFRVGGENELDLIMNDKPVILL